MRNISNLKRVCALTLCAVLMLALMGGCSSPSPSAAVGSQDTPSETPVKKTAAELGLLSEGVLKVGMEIGYPPFEMYSDDKKPMGLDVEMAAELAALLGVEVQYEDTAWDGIFSGLDIDKYDCVISAVTINAERKETMDFTNPYIENWQAIAVKKGSTPIKSMLELNGLKVGYQDETTSDEYLSDFRATGQIDCTVSEYDKVINCFDDLKLGRIDAVLADSTVAEGYVARESNEFEITWIQSTEQGAEAELFGVAVKKGNEKLQTALNDALKTLEENGTLDEIRGAWLS